MKKLAAVFVRVLTALLAAYPLATLVCACFGCVFRLTGFAASGALTALAALGAAGLGLPAKGGAYLESDGLLCALTAPLALLWALFRLFLFRVGSPGEAFCVVLTVAACVCLSLRHGRPRAPGVAAAVLAALLLSPPGLAVIVLGSVGEETVIRTELSPDGKYCAEVIDSDQGAMGGATRVTVRESGELDAWFFRVTKKPRTLWSGGWGEGDELEVRWEDEHHLAVKSRVYEIP